MRAMDVRARHNIKISGRDDAPPMLFAHGFGCDQNMWRHVAPAFEDRYRVITFDHVGAGGSDPDAYDPDKYASLDGYAADVVDIVRELDLREVVFVGHSVSSMVGALAEIAEPDRFARLVMVGPSPRYIDDDDYTGGFSEADIHDLLDSLGSNYLGWSSRHGAGDHGQRRAAGARARAHGELLPDGPRDRPSVRRPPRSSPTTAPTCRRSRRRRWCCSAART